MRQIINFIDRNVDGCGTNVETMIQVESNAPLTNEVIQRTKDVIEKYKVENEGNWTTDDVVEEACYHLEEEGYMCDTITPDEVIEF